MYTFIFSNYILEPAKHKISFDYRYEQDDKTIGTFTEVFQLPATISLDTDDATLQKIAAYMHIIVGISYYKSLLGDVVLPYELNAQEAAYFNTIYDTGLGEYKYINKLTQTIRPFTATSQSPSQTNTIATSGALLGVGGGKDSIVAGEILKKLGITTTALDMATRDNHGQAKAVMDIMAIPQLTVGRYLDTKIIAFTEQHGGMNGHVPLSTIIAWLGVLLAYTTKTKYIAVANESATSTGNTVWNNQEVNHQWAKSLEQERLTSDFIHGHVSPDIDYLSPIRPYSSLLVMELLATLGRQYLPAFTSCNLVLRIDPAGRPNGRWCTTCAKCLSTWMLLSSWLSTSELTAIFGKNLWEDTSLRSNLEALLGLSGHKPLDCVGTVEELRAVTRKFILSEEPAALLKAISPDDIPGPSIDDLIAQRSEHNLPHDLASSIETVVRQYS